MLRDLDWSLDKFAEFVHNSGSMRMDANVEKTEAFLRQQASDHLDMLLHEADNVTVPRNRGIAVAALGFSGSEAALDPLLNAVNADNPDVVANAVFGLAMLHDRRTPPSAFSTIIEDPERSPELRASAAWGLYELQQAIVETAPIVAIWVRLMSGPIDSMPPGVAVQALRGLGLTRDPNQLELVERYAAHPTPLVRWAAAIALGRIGDVGAVPTLLRLLGSGEPNQNVHLGARKALQALAGGVDLGYDVKEWQKVFDRGS